MTEDQREAWRKALAAHHRQQRQQRGRERDASSYRPGMARLSPPTAHDNGVTTLPRCPFPGCPIRYRGGPNRECPEHQNEADFGWMEAPPSGDGDGDHAQDGDRWPSTIRPAGPALH